MPDRCESSKRRKDNRRKQSHANAHRARRRKQSHANAAQRARRQKQSHDAAQRARIQKQHQIRARNRTQIINTCRNTKKLSTSN